MSRDDAFTCRLNTDKLATVLGVDRTRLHGYLAVSSSGVPTVALCGHSILAGNLNVGRAAICTECVEERGYVPAWFDLKVVDACPTHRRQLVRMCTHCQRGLNRLRPELLKCNCGASLTGVLGAPIANEHAELLAYLVSKFNNGTPFASSYGMPAAWLSTMTLGRLVRLVDVLASMHVAATRQRNVSNSQRAAKMLEQWPRNLYAAMNELIPDGSSGNGAALLRNHAEGVYRTWLSKVSAAPDIAFLRSALAGFEPGLAASTPTALAIPEAFARPPTPAKGPDEPALGKFCITRC